MKTKNTLGIVASIIAFVTSEFVLDYYIETASLTTKVLFVIVVAKVYHLILETFYTENT